MKKSIKEEIKRDIKRNYKYYIFLIFVFLLVVIRLDYYIYSPGSLIDLTDRIEVENAYPQSGNFNLTYVTSRSGNLLNVILSYIIPSWDLEKVDDMRIQDESTKAIEERDKIYLKETSYDAIIAAFSEAGLPYTIESNDITVTYVMNEADTDIKVNDIIKSVNGIEINNYEELTNVISQYKEKDRINIKVIRDSKELDCYSILYKEEDRVLIGITLAQIKKIKTTPDVEYVFKNNESGSSRGLMCALDIYNKITSFDLTKGRVIAGTGSIDENGNIGSIGGVKYKLIGAVKKKADIFIVPSENYEEALKIKEENNYKIEIIEGDTLHNVIEKLK